MSLIKFKKERDLFPSLLSNFFDSDKFFDGKWLDKAFEITLPAVNIKENKSAYNVEFVAPGFRKSDFKISIEDHILTVSAEKEAEINDENDRFTRKEFSYNSFERSFNLPENVNNDEVEAKYNNGILHLQIKKIEKTKANPKKEFLVE